MTYNPKKYHILTSISETPRFFVGVIDKKHKRNCVESKHKVDRTGEFWNALVSQYKNTSWKLNSKKEELRLMILDQDKFEKHKHETLEEFFDKKEDE